MHDTNVYLKLVCRTCAMSSLRRSSACRRSLSLASRVRSSTASEVVRAAASKRLRSSASLSAIVPSASSNLRLHHRSNVCSIPCNTNTQNNIPYLHILCISLSTIPYFGLNDFSSFKLINIQNGVKLKCKIKQ